MTNITTFTLLPEGRFDLTNQTNYFGKWLSPIKDPETVVLPFPGEGWLRRETETPKKRNFSQK